MSSTCDLGGEMFSLASRLFPIHRFITGEGVRSTFAVLKEYLPLDILEIESGSPVYDWEVPQEWRIRDAFVADDRGRRLIDYAQSNLHVANGSTGIDETMSWNELSSHVFTAPDRPSAIPYRSMAFHDDWGFCCTESTKERLAGSRENYHVKIDAEYFDGSLSIAECEIPGETDRTVLIYAHSCHPSLANDNLSGMVVASVLGQILLGRRNRMSYRIVFAPATIGAITWLSIHENTHIPKVDYGLVLSLLGSDSAFTYKSSRRENAAIDRIAKASVSKRGGSLRSFQPFGYDERQFCSPGFNLPVGCLSRAPHGEFPEYHTSDDNMVFVRGERLVESLQLCLEIIDTIERAGSAANEVCTRAGIREESVVDRAYPYSLYPKCEPRLGKHDLYQGYGFRAEFKEMQESIMWVLNLSDGFHSLDAMAQRSRLSRGKIERAVSLLQQHGLITVGETG